MKRDFSPSLKPAIQRTGVGLVLALGLCSTALTADLANQPVFSTSSVPGNLALALSVEWPTASRTAHVDNYSSASEYLGYFDPKKCYLYRANTASNGVSDTSKGDQGYFYPQGTATDHTCTGDNDTKWSGNFLNWAATPTIDPFRWAMTGGRRVVDKGPSDGDEIYPAGTTIIEKAWHSGQGLFPDRDLTTSEIVGATPLTNAGLTVHVNGMGFKMELIKTIRSFTAQYFNNNNFNGTPALTVSNDNAYHDWGGGSPGDGVSNDTFSSRLVGTFTAPAAGSYRFRVVSDDGVKVWVDTGGDENFTSSNRRISETAYGTYTSQDISLNAGQRFSIKIEHIEGSGDSKLQLLWRLPSSSSYIPFGVESETYTMRVKVCDSSTAAGGLEANCKRYGNYYKPEGLIQQYSDRMRFSAFGYLNDSSGKNDATSVADAPRDGGVMRARQKFVGPTYPAPGAPPVNNTAREWDPETGVFAQNPDGEDASTTASTFSVTIQDSGVMNYLNKFGQLYPGNYKSFDPVSEMYYAVLRYYRNLGNVPAWSNMAGASDDTRRTYIDGFPVIENWDDPIQYSCQRNFVLGIGDIYTHVDKNVPGNSRTTGERSMPSQVSGDTTVNAVTATNKVGALQNFHSTDLGSYSSGRNNSYYMAGLAYDANTTDIRPDNSSNAATIGKQTVQTYWVDVLEAAFVANNQFYLTAKYGGMKVPTDFNPYAATTTAATIQDSWWRNNTETVGSGSNQQPRPDNYFTGGRPDTLISGLARAFESIASAIKAYTTSFSLSTAQVSESGGAAYASQYDSSDWSGVLTARRLSFTSDGTPSAVDAWSSSDKLATQLGGTGWDTNRRVVTWNGTRGVPFRSATGGVSAAQLSQLTNTYGGTTTPANYLDYLRGDQSRETTNGGPFRKRTVLLGDIVNAKVTPVGPPNSPYGETLNPGYAAFKSARTTRPTMVYVGANDGMLHAFNGSIAANDANAGKEQFAYVPSAVFSGPNGTPQVDGLAQLGNPNYTHHYYVDATPLVFDIDLGYAGGTFTTTADGTGADWHSILIGGLGKGGRSYYAIDVSNPETMSDEATAAGKVLWEFTDSTMGYSYGAPVVVRTKKYGWVVVFTSGYKDGDNTDNGYLYFVNPRDGTLLEKVSTGESAPGLTYASAYVQDFAKYESDAIYVGDLNGVVWRFDLTATSGAYPAPVKLATLTDGATTPAAQPITTPPLIEISPTTRKRFVMVGTGRLLAATDINSAAQQGFYGILDGTAGTFSSVSSPATRSQMTPVTDVLTGISLSGTSRGWYIDLGTTGTGSSTIGWRIATPPVAYNGVVAFSGMLTTGDACSPSGKSRVYVLDFTTGKTKLSPTAPYQAFNNSVTDMRFVSLNGRPLLIAGDNQGGIQKVGADLSGSSSIKLLNWRELPTVN